MATSTIRQVVNYNTLTVTTNASGAFYITYKPNVLSAFVLNDMNEYIVELHTYGASIYGKLFDINHNAVPNTTVTIGYWTAIQ